MHLATQKQGTNRFKDCDSSALNFSNSLSILSLQPLPFKQTGLSSVEKAALKTPAMVSQSAGLLGRMAATSFARERSCVISGHRNCGILNLRTIRAILRTRNNSRKYYRHLNVMPISYTTRRNSPNAGGLKESRKN